MIIAKNKNRLNAECSEKKCHTIELDCRVVDLKRPVMIDDLVDFVY